MKLIIDTNRQTNIKRFSSYITEKVTAHKDDVQYLTMDNGGLPYIINYEEEYNNVRIYDGVFSMNDVKKVFTGEDQHGDKNATFLINTKDNEYVQVGNQGIFQFETADDDKIEEYISPIGNSAVPYPYAIGKKYIYFMLDYVYVDKKEFETIFKRITKEKKYKRVEHGGADYYGAFYTCTDIYVKNGEFDGEKIDKEDICKTYKMKKFKELAKRDYRKWKDI